MADWLKDETLVRKFIRLFRYSDNGPVMYALLHLTSRNRLLKGVQGGDLKLVKAGATADDATAYAEANGYTEINVRTRAADYIKRHGHLVQPTK